MAEAEDSTRTEPRLVLEPLTVEHAAEMVPVLADPRLYAVIGGDPPDLEALTSRYQAQTAGQSPDGAETWRNWIVRRRSDGAAIGFTQATITDHGGTAELAWVIGSPWQGQGYATEATHAMLAELAALGVRRVQAHVHPDHPASQAVARHVGLTPTEDWVDGELVWSGDLS